jgi:chromosome segregation ATPase
MTQADVRVDQLAEQARMLAGTVESQSAALDALSARLEALEGQLQAALAMQTTGAERIERLAVELDAGPRIDVLSSQIEALRQAHERDAERLEKLAAQMVRIEEQRSVRQLSNEVSARIEAIEIKIESELDEMRRRAAAEQAAIAVELQNSADRTLEVEGELERITSLERHISETDRSVQGLSSELAEAAEQRSRILESFRQTEQRLVSRIEALSAKLDETTDEVASWRALIDKQSRTVHEARAVADSMREEAQRLREEHHAVAEAQRLAEERVEASLARMRDESEHTWSLFLAQRDKDRQAAAAASAARDEKLKEHTADLERALAGLDDLAGRLASESERQTESLWQLRRELTETLQQLRDHAATALERVGAGLPPDEQPGVEAERRDATRRALRARRGTDED